MTTVINTPPNRERADGGGWALSVIMLIVVIGIGVFFWLNFRDTSTAQTPETMDTSTNISVTLPSANTLAPETAQLE
ncbi:MAG: hypothetical protein QY304_00465 [Candidatus Paceibacterota bacterium]|nr:MAG: hypothetical protein QY304_00465 [Candidatus Paceibacterota bacterium]